MKTTFPECSLTEDEIEINSQKIQEPLTALILNSSNALKEAFKSQQKLTEKINLLDLCLTEINDLNNSIIKTNFKQEISKIHSMKTRISKLQKRMNALQDRFNVIEQHVHQNYFSLIQ